MKRKKIKRKKSITLYDIYKLETNINNIKNILEEIEMEYNILEIIL